MGQVRSQMASGSSVLPQSQFKPAFTNVDADKLRTAILPTVAPIDTKRFEALGSKARSAGSTCKSATRNLTCRCRGEPGIAPLRQRRAADGQDVAIAINAAQRTNTLSIHSASIRI